MPSDQANEYTPTASPGGRAPHVWFSDGSSLYDKFGFEFTLICLCSDVNISKIREIASAKNLPLSIIEVFEKSVRDLYQADLVLVRPDQVVVWRGNNGNCIDVVLDQVTGH